jgi:hypothetical protein
MRSPAPNMTQPNNLQRGNPSQMPNFNPSMGQMGTNMAQQGGFPNNQFPAQPPPTAQNSSNHVNSMLRGVSTKPSNMGMGQGMVNQIPNQMNSQMRPPVQRNTGMSNLMGMPSNLGNPAMPNNMVNPQMNPIGYRPPQMGGPPQMVPNQMQSTNQMAGGQIPVHNQRGKYSSYTIRKMCFGASYFF